MSLLANHGVIGRHRLTPVLVSQTATVNCTGTGTDTFVITPTSTPVAGNLLVLYGGGLQTRTVVTPPSGFTQVNSLGAFGTNLLFWKIATGSEPANYTIVWSAALSGGMNLVEASGVELTSPIDFQVGAESASATTLPLPSYNVTMPGIAFTYTAKSLTSNWTPDNSFSSLNAAGESKKALRIYSLPAAGEITTWSGAVQQVNTDLIFFKGKLT